MESAQPTETIAIRGEGEKEKSQAKMQGTKRDRHGNARKFEHKREAPKEVVRNAYTPMFEAFRDELDEHDDRRERVIKASRDVTALSKKM